MTKKLTEVKKLILFICWVNTSGVFLNEKVVQDNVYCLTKNMILQLRNKVQLSLREYYQFCSHKLKYSTHLKIYGGARWKVEGSANF